MLPSSAMIGFARLAVKKGRNTVGAANVSVEVH